MQKHNYCTYQLGPAQCVRNLQQIRTTERETGQQRTDKSSAAKVTFTNWKNYKQIQKSFDEPKTKSLLTTLLKMD
jgi:hypothetical protein